MKKLTICALIISSLSYAAAITGLCNTGKATCDGPFLPNGSVDSHYTVVSGPVTGSTFVGAHPAWTSRDADSQWIGPTNGTNQVPGGYYTYQTTFNASTTNVMISGLWSADNAGYDIILNGKSLLNNGISGSGLFPYYGFDGVQTMTPFTITSGFAIGTNTLDFVVQNGNFANDTTAPSGLRVSMTASAITSTPEPSTFALISFFLVAGSALIWRRSAKKIVR